MVANHQSLFFRTFLLTTIIFVLGVVIGFSVDTLRSRDVVDTLRESELDEQSFLIEQEFFRALEGYDCSFVQTRLSALSKKLGELGFYLVNYDDKSFFKRDEYDYLLRKYLLTEIRVYSLFSDLKQTCHLNATLILYFFDPQDALSERQGRILDVLVKKYPSVFVFSINERYREDLLLENVKQYYNITITPSLIINGEEKKEGLVQLETLEEIL